MPSVNPELWKQAGPYLDRALELPAEERAVWLQSFRASHPDLAEFIESLLKEHSDAAEEHFLERSPISPGENASDGRKGQSLGPYTLLSPIGQGGMGSVWLAERSDGRFERRVAVKFLRFALGTHGAVQRFAREGKILGQLADPHIAELIDAGVTHGGEPYLVLEYVEGQPIDEYCDQRALNVDARLRLFLDVLDAVAAAHAQLIVHRDIKPSNVLVRNDGQVKLLDFGIAKLLADTETPAEATLVTLEAGAALTPRFAAPEQLTGRQITTATDVYALGVLLYALLTGRHPAGMAAQSTAELVKAIVEREPPRISDAVDARDEEAARKRSTLPEKLRRALRGDLDLIVGKALKKNTLERYASVAAFGDDLRRYLHHDPISARPDTISYRLRKYVHRHRVGVGIAASLVLLLAGFSTIQAIELRRITRERDRASRVTEFMTNMFKVSDPNEARGNTITAREILDRASKEIDTGLGKDPELQAQMMSVMGDVYDDLGLYHTADSLLTHAIQIQSAVLGPNDSETLNSKALLGWIFQEEGRYPEAEKLQRETLQNARRVLGPEHPVTLSVMSNLSVTLFEEGRYREAENFNRETIDIERRVLGPDSPRTLSTMNNLGTDLYWEGRYAEAEQLDREVQNAAIRTAGADSPTALAAADNLALNLSQEGRYAEAEKLDRDTLAIERRVFGPDHPSTVNAIGNLGLYIKHQGRYAEAEVLIRQALEINRRVRGPDHLLTAQCTYNLGCIAALKGDRDQALALIRQAVDHGFIPSIDVSVIEQDPDLKSLHGDPRFAALIAHAKEKEAASRK